MFRSLIPLVAMVPLLFGCRPASPPAAAHVHTNQQIFEVKGVVVEVKAAEASVKIKHEEVPDYMPAMTMPFDVKDTNELAGLEPGHPVTFRLLVTDTEGWIDHIRITGPKTNLMPATGNFRRVRDVEPLVEGEALPEYQFINQFARSFSTKDFAGQALAIEFLFTRCPLPNFCPYLANNFGAAQKQLLAMPAAPTNWHLLTISFDTEFDSPAVLKSYGESHGADFRHWTFASGDPVDVTAIGEQFGLKVERDDNGGFNHNLRAVVIDAAGRVRKIFIGNEWKSEELVTELLKASAAK